MCPYSIITSTLESGGPSPFFSKYIRVCGLRHLSHLLPCCCSAKAEMISKERPCMCSNKTLLTNTGGGHSLPTSNIYLVLTASSITSIKCNYHADKGKFFHACVFTIWSNAWQNKWSSMNKSMSDLLFTQLKHKWEQGGNIRYGTPTPHIKHFPSSPHTLGGSGYCIQLTLTEYRGVFFWRGW